MGTRTTLAALLASLLTLTACGGSTSVADPPVGRTSTSASAPPPMNRESPEHFIRRFYAAEKNMENSGETHEYESLTRGCRSCASLTREVRRFYAQGGYVRWGGMAIKSIERSSAAGARIAFEVRGIAKPTTYAASSSAVPSHLAGGSTTELVTLHRSNTHWHVVGFTKVGSN